MAKNKGQYLLDGTFQQWWDIDAYHKGIDTFDLVVDETDGLLYLQINGQNVGEGVEVTGGGGVVRYNVSYTIPHVTSSDASTKIIEGRTFTTQLTADQDFEIKSVTVTMGSVEVPNSYNAETGIVTVSNVTGDLAIVVVSKALVIFNEVQWLDTSYGIGDNKSAYNGWCPGCAKYDETLNKVIFLQCHVTAHSGTYSASELWAIDPYNVMNNPVKLGEFPVAKGIPLAFDIYDGTYYVVSTKTVYSSSDHGATWQENTIATAPTRDYGLKIIDDVMYLGDDGSAVGAYYTSSDWGLNWETHTFDFVSDYESADLTCCEAEFIKFNGRIYASLRRGVDTGEQGILAVQDNGVWKVISEELPNVNSDCFLFATDSDVIAFAAIDRPNTTIKLGTITIDENDVATVSIAKSVNVNGGSKPGDFHTPTYVIGPDFHMVTFMTSANGNEYNTANNACLVGYTDLSLNENPSYSVTTYDTGINYADVDQSAYAGAVTFDENGHPVCNANAGAVNFSRHVASCYPPENDIVFTYLANPGEQYTIGSHLGYFVYDGVSCNSKMYVCRNTGSRIKQMYPAKKKTVLNISNMTQVGQLTNPVVPLVNWTGASASNEIYRYVGARASWYASLVEPQNVGTL